MTQLYSPAATGTEDQQVRTVSYGLAPGGLDEDVDVQSEESPGETREQPRTDTHAEPQAGESIDGGRAGHARDATPWPVARRSRAESR